MWRLLLLVPSIALAQNTPFGGQDPVAGLSGTNTGDVTLGAIGSSPSATGDSISGQVLTLQPADATHPGVVTVSAQTWAGNKTFTGILFGADGTAGAPEFSFTSDPDTGIFSAGANKLGLSVGGAATLTVAHVAGVAAMSIGSRHSSGIGALWLNPTATPSASNFSLDTDSSGNVSLNGNTSVVFTLNNGSICAVSSLGLNCTTGALMVSSLKAPVVHGAGVAQQAMESGKAAMTAGALAVTFGTAFGAAPACTCSAETAIACTISVAASTTAVTFAAAAGGSNVVDWICVGQK